MKFNKTEIQSVTLLIIISVGLFILICGLGYLITAGCYYLVTLICANFFNIIIPFGWDYALGIWLILIILRLLFNPSIKFNSKD